MRVAVIDREKCKPEECNKECFRFCPMVRTGKEAVRFEEGKPVISEALCSGCGICVKKCPFGAVRVVKLPDELEGECAHRYGVNGFKLFRLPLPVEGKVVGLLGQNGTGKTTALRILAGELKPNLGDVLGMTSIEEVAKRFRGTVLYKHFMALKAGRLKTILKPQYISKVVEGLEGTAGQILQEWDERGEARRLAKSLELEGVLNRDVKKLSGGELQRLLIAACLCKEADLYIFDEPSSHLDVRQRIKAAREIRKIAQEGKKVLVAEHDLAVLDYLSDYIHIFYGVPGVYGIVSQPYGTGVGINKYLLGYLKEENVRFRDKPVLFHEKTPERPEAGEVLLSWSRMVKRYEGFELVVEGGNLKVGEVIGVLGPNGIGKTTFAKIIAGVEKPDEGEEPERKAKISYKPQYLVSDIPGTVREALASLRVSIGEWEESTIIKPFGLDSLLDKEIRELSGGELQRLAIAMCLLREADVYVLDEPSAFLDVEERLAMARAIRKTVEMKRKAAIVVEHDVCAQDFIADRIMVFSGEPGRKGHAHKPVSMREGMNAFLKDVGITFRRDPTTRRPRVNKEGSKLDRYQKSIGQYYYVD